MSRFFAIVHARNLEFVRDHAALGWNILFPVLLMVGFALLFSGGERAIYRVGLLSSGSHPLEQARLVQTIPVTDRAAAIIQVERHQLDLLLDWSERRYWVNSSAPNGYIAEQILLAATRSEPAPPTRSPVTGREIRYVDWLVPGLLGMNMMFNALYGIGFVIVRYRKNGVLKRLSGTPLTALEFLGAQIVSRLILILGVTTVVYVGCDQLLNFTMYGSYALLLLVLLFGSLAMIAMGLVIAARLHNDELASGIANFISWPMMLLSGVWFSLEGSPPWIQQLAQLLPLTQAIEAGRAVMLEGAGLTVIAPHLLALAATTAVCMVLGVWLFRWQ